MSTLVPIKKLFEPIYGVNLELLNVDITDKNDPQSIQFISRKEVDNGLVAYVKRIENIPPNPAHTISVAVSGSVLSSFYHEQEYYSGRDIYYLLPRSKMSVEEMLFYAFCLQANKYRYNYGRGANRTLKDILVPDKMPTDFRNAIVSKIEIPKPAPIVLTPPKLNTENWTKFQLSDLFDVNKGKRLTKEDMEEGNTPFIGAITSNNGWSNSIGQPPIFKGNVITVNYDGNGVGEAYYQPVPFWALDSVNVLYPKFELNKYIALFICTTIKKEKFRFSYGRKWNASRMEATKIKLPSKNDKPDFLFMENYIKSLPYSYSLLIDKTSIVESASSPLKKPKIVKVLPDEELVKKYENDEINLNQTLKPALHNTKNKN